MLRIVTNKAESRKCQKVLLQALNNSLTLSNKFTVGFPSGSINCTVKYDSDIWFTGKEIKRESSPRFWNSFGLAKDLQKNKQNNIIVEINIPTNGLNRKVSGIFAINDKTKSVFLLHRGRVGGGRKGIGKKAFVNWYSHSFVKIKNGSEIEEAILIGDITKKDFTKKLAKFVQSIASFKAFATSNEANEASFLSDNELINKIDNKRKKTIKIKVTTHVHERNNYVSEFAKRRANGKCQLCKKTAPFKSKSGRPYLEAHHIIWLSNRGSDTLENTVALCPNCHKKMHIVADKHDIEQLKKVILI